jgi:hypothetical protein
MPRSRSTAYFVSSFSWAAIRSSPMSHPHRRGEHQREGVQIDIAVRQEWYSCYGGAGRRHATGHRIRFEDVPRR